MKRRLCLLFAMFLLVCSFAVPVLAAQSGGPVYVAGSTYYDPVEKGFLYYVDTTTVQAIRSNVADGMITSQSVSVKADAGVALEMYLNGNRMEGSTGGVFQNPGEYVVMYSGGTVPQRIFSFTIVPQVCNYVTSYAIPSGFEIISATLDDVAIAYDNNYVKLTEEGRYNIQYCCTKTGISYQLQVKTDFTGPILSLEEVSEGFARGPVDISEAKNAAYVNIYHNGEKISRKDVLTESGEYYIELADDAGNMTTYSFTILIYFDGNSWLAFLIILGVCIAVVAYLMRSRKHLRVR